MGTSIILFVIGLGLVIYFSEQLVKGAVGTSISFGISTFIISVIFIGFDPENLALGSIASYEEAAGIALGTIIGAAMVAVGLAFGVTALISPMHFKQVPKHILAVPVLSVLLFGVLGFDGQLSRLDGALLLLCFVFSLIYMVRLSRLGIDIKPEGEVAETLEENKEQSKWKSLGLLLFSLAAIILGSEMIIIGSEAVIASFGLSDTVFGMTILALLVSIEELARELPAAIKGRPEISFGNVTGSILAFFLFNAGIISLIRPVPINDQVQKFFFPLCLVTIVVISAFMMKKKVSRMSGIILIMIYLIFFVGGYIL